MSMKRAASAAASSSSSDKEKDKDDLMSDPRVLKQSLRHARIRLLERSTAFEELSQINQDNVKAIKQQVRYSQELETIWNELDQSLRILAPQVSDATPPPASVPSLRRQPSDAYSRSQYKNPVLAMLETSWSELSGEPVSAMKKEMKKSLSSSAAAANGSDDADMMDADNVGEDDEEEDDAAVQEKNSSAPVVFDEELSAKLKKRVNFTHSLLNSVVQQLKKPSGQNTDAARLALLQAENFELNNRLHSCTNELILMNTTLREKETSMEELEEKYKTSTRRLERLKQDVETGKLATGVKKDVKEEGSNVKSESGASSSEKDTVMSTENGVKLESSAAASFAAAAARASDASDTRPMSPRTLNEFSPSTHASATTPHLTSAAIAKMREELSDFTLLAERRLKELTQLKADKTQLEMRLQKARMTILEDESAIKSSKTFQSLYRSYESQRSEKQRFQLLYEELQARYSEMENIKDKLHEEFTSQMEHAERQFDKECATLSSNIESLQNSNLQLQQEKDDLAASAPSAEVNIFLTKLRTTIIPELERQLKEGVDFQEKFRLEKEALEQLKNDKENEDKLRLFAKVMRTWKCKEIALNAQIHALSKSSSTSSSSSASSSQTTRITALENEVAELKKRLEQVQSAPSSELAQELESSKEMNQALGDELNSIASMHEEAQAAVSRQSAASVEFTKTLDKLRQEKTQATKLTALLKQEAQVLKAKMDQLEQNASQHVRVAKDLKALSEASQKETSKLKEQVTQSSTIIDELRAGELKSKQDNSEYKIKYQQIASQHTRCEEEIKELRERDVSSSESNRRVAEQYLVLKNRYKTLEKQMGADSKSKSSAANVSADALRIKQLQLLVNCKVCETQPKSKVIVKCMHCFCADCIQSNLDTRNRKCPQCGLKFGENDVKNLYL